MDNNNRSTGGFWFVIVVLILGVVALVVGLLYYFNKSRVDTVANWAEGFGILGGIVDSSITFGSWISGMWHKNVTLQDNSQFITTEPA